MQISCTGDAVTDGRQIEMASLIPSSSAVSYAGENTFFHFNGPDARLQHQRYPVLCQLGSIVFKVIILTMFMMMKPNFQFYLQLLCITLWPLKLFPFIFYISI